MLIDVFSNSELKKFSTQAKNQRKKLFRHRDRLWIKNSKEFERNVEKLIKIAKLPKEWKIYTLASHFIGGKKIMPYDYDSWSIVLLIAATKKQGHELLFFYNKSRTGFFSLPAFIPLLVHELTHIHQAALNPREYNNGAFDDKYGSLLEKSAEEKVLKLPRILIDEAVLESVLYCYDKKGWKSAEKMINFLYKDRVNFYTGGYLPWVLEEDYNSFQEAKEKKNISLFLNYYLSSNKLRGEI